MRIQFPKKKTNETKTCQLQIHLTLTSIELILPDKKIN